MAFRRLRKQRDPEGRMSLGDHLRELRRRVVISILAILVCAGLGWWKYTWIFEQFEKPINDLVKESSTGGTAIATINFSGMTDSFSLLITVGLFVGVVLASPVWLFQTWAFIMPGLTGRERRISLLFIGAAVPLFVGGCALGYWTFPRAVHALLSFTPEGASNILQADQYLNFILKFVLAFGLAFLLPVFLVGLNAAGVLPARIMIRGWRPAVFLIFVFGAMMTPSPDPWSMILLALPMVALYFAAVGIGFLLDRRRARRTSVAAPWRDLPDDQASAI